MLTEKYKQGLLDYLSQTIPLQGILYDANLLPECIENDPYQEHFMYGAIAMYRNLEKGNTIPKRTDNQQ